VVNSKFTAKVYQEAFPSLVELPKVIYPAADFDSFTPPDWDAKSKKRGEPSACYILRLFFRP